MRFSNLRRRQCSSEGTPTKWNTYRRLIALSSCQGMFVAPRTRTPLSSCPTPFICTRNSVFIRLEPSDSDSFLVPASESISSIKIIAGLFSRASSKRFLTNLKED